MSKNPNEIYEESVIKWRNNSKGIIVYNNSLDIFMPVFIILEKMLSKNVKTTVLIILPNNNYFDIFTTKLVSNKIFTHFSCINNNIKVVVQDNLDEIEADSKYDLLILIRAEDILNNPDNKILTIDAKHLLLLSNDNGISNHIALPIIDSVLKTDVFVKNIATDIIEYNYGIDMSENDRDIYDRMNTFIKDTITIFNGDIDLVFKCYSGGKEKNKQGVEIGDELSGDYFRQIIAEYNGWNKDMDLSIDFNKDIDRYYNPNALYERSKTFNNIILERKKLLSDNTAKINAVINVINKCKDKKILIVSKRSQFASKLTDVINKEIPYDIKPDIFNYGTISNTVLSPNTCLNFNSDLETILIKKDNDYVRTKSGTIKKLGVTAQNKLANELFNSGLVNVLSVNDSLPAYGNFNIDIVIFTSPDCKSIHKLKYRVSNLKFFNKTIIVNIFLNGTKEEDTIINNQSLNKNIVENFNNFLLNVC
jgi:hypothetical protein